MVSKSTNNTAAWNAAGPIHAVYKSISKNHTILLMLVNFAHVCLPAYPNTCDKYRHNKAVILPDFHSLIVHTKQNIYGRPDGIISEL